MCAPTTFAQNAARPIAGGSARTVPLAARRCAWVGAFALVAVGAFRERIPRLGRSTLKMSTASAGSDTALLGGGAGTVVPAPNGRASAAVIFLHGLGDTCAGWAPIFPILPHVTTVLPTAATQPVSLNMGMSMPSWFDLYGLDPSAKDDSDGIAKAVERVSQIVRALPVPSNRVVVAGFSQGGAVALTAALRSEDKLAGAAALSSFLPMRDEYPAKFSAHAKDTPLFVAHGDADQVVPISFGGASAEILRGHGIEVTVRTYPGMGHSACDQELQDFKDFLERVIPPVP